MLGRVADARRALPRLRRSAYARPEIYEAVVDLIDGDRERAREVLRCYPAALPREAMLQAAVFSAAGDESVAKRLRQPDVFSFLKSRTARLLAGGSLWTPREAFDTATELAWVSLAWEALDRSTADRLWERAESLLAERRLIHLLDFYRPLRELARRSGLNRSEITVE